MPEEWSRAKTLREHCTRVSVGAIGHMSSLNSRARSPHRRPLSRRLPLTVTIIASNEADRILDAIASAAFADEVLVLESASTDGTAEACRRAGARVVETDWPGFVAQKQRAVAYARHEWIFSLDADERIPAALAEEIRSKLDAPGVHVAFSVPRRTWWQGVPIRWGAWSPDRRCRLFRRTAGRWTGQDPHDRWRPEGLVGRLHTPLVHHAYRGLEDHLRTVARYSQLQADLLVRSGRTARWWDWGLRPLVHLCKALVWKGGIFDGPRGVAIAFVGAAHVALKWALVSVRQNAPSTTTESEE
ncbi:MAG: hypothetical protein CL927_08380 [Deltaproteobacteria bacterium]|nr:hypothetical protein [Deltaproteobacteria bacterium]